MAFWNGPLFPAASRTPRKTTQRGATVGALGAELSHSYRERWLELAGAAGGEGRQECCAPQRPGRSSLRFLQRRSFGTCDEVGRGDRIKKLAAPDAIVVESPMLPRRGQQEVLESSYNEKRAPGKPGRRCVSLPSSRTLVRGASARGVAGGGGDGRLPPTLYCRPGLG